MHRYVTASITLEIWKGISGVVCLW